MSTIRVIEEIEGFYRVFALDALRRMPGSAFDNVPMTALPRIDAIDRVIHEGGACSPGPVGHIQHPWYMHPYQDDNLLVLHGVRTVDIYTRQHDRVETFVITPDQVLHGERVVCDRPAMLVWPRGVFHRIQSSPELGSASVNLAVHYDGFDIDTNFNVYDLDPASGDYRVIREGHLDQP